MGSRIMHYGISSILADKLHIQDRERFMLGGIAPDIHGLMGVPKDVTHFKDRSVDGKSQINYRRFYETYAEVIHDPFYLGYLCHLISDVAWIDTYFNIVQFESAEQWNDKLQTAYRDFARLNGRIIEQYFLQLHQHVLPEVSIEGYNSAFIPALLECLRQDFSMNEALMNEPLELFRNDNSEITEFIDTSVQKSVAFVASVRGAG